MIKSIDGILPLIIFEWIIWPFINISNAPVDDNYVIMKLKIIYPKNPALILFELIYVFQISIFSLNYLSNNIKAIINPY